jgi:hypothetical protein
MFRHTILLSALLLMLSVLFWGFLLGRVRPEDIAVIQKAEKEQEIASSTSLFSTTEQKRKGVVKEIWFTQEDNQRLHYRIISEGSLLTLQPDGKKFDLIEKLEHIKCWMQDKLTEGPMQQVRFFQAEEGWYRYSSQEFIAQSVALSLFRLPGHALPRDVGKLNPFLKGIAQDVSFAVSGKNPQFKAQDFKAQLNRSTQEKP